MSRRKIKCNVPLESLHLDKNRRKEEILLTRFKTALIQLPHSVFPAFTVSKHPLTSLTELEEYPSCALSSPRCVFVAAYNSPAIDMCHKRTMQAEQHMRRLQYARHYYLLAKKKSKEHRKAEKEGWYHSGVFEFAERLHSNPDPFFHSNFDYYYTSGNLCVLPENDLVLHVTSDELNTLNISEFSKAQGLFNTKLISTSAYESEMGSEIFCIKPLNKLNENIINCFALRHLKSVLIMHKVDDTIVPIADFHNKASPFISFAQSPGNPHDFIVSTMKQHVRLYDLNTGPTELKSLWQLGSSPDDNSWNTILPWAENTFVYANSRKLLIMDIRTKEEEWQKTCTLPPYDLSCDIISSLAASKFKNLLYVGTSHKLHCVDVRYMKHHFEQSNGAVCRWTHQLDSPPAFLDTHRVGTSEYVAISSALAGDLRICELKRLMKFDSVASDSSAESKSTCKYIFQSPSIPWQPPTLQEAFDSARQAGQCLMPEKNLKERINFCTTGLTFYTDTWSKEPKTVLLTTNSCGDMYASNLDWSENRSYERTNEQSHQAMTKYAKKVGRIPQPPVKYTDIVDASALRKILRCEALDRKPEDDEFEPERPRRFGRWQKSLRQLLSYKDLLAKEILQVWDIEENEEKPLSLTKLNNETDANKDVYIRSWLTENSPLNDKRTSPQMFADTIDSNVPMESQTMETFEQEAATVMQSTQNLSESANSERMDINATVMQSTQNLSESANSERMDINDSMEVRSVFKEISPSFALPTAPTPPLPPLPPSPQPAIPTESKGNDLSEKPSTSIGAKKIKRKSKYVKGF